MVNYLYRLGTFNRDVRLVWTCRLTARWLALYRCVRRPDLGIDDPDAAAYVIQRVPAPRGHHAHAIATSEC